MQIIPSLNIKNGKVLIPEPQSSDATRKGDISDPLEAAELLVKHGAEKLHIVDLDGAVSGELSNNAIITELAKKIPVPVQVAGGIRQLAQIDYYLDGGVQQVVLGTVAVKYPLLIYQMIKNFGKDRIIISIDVLKDKIQYDGWKEGAEIPVPTFIKIMEDQGVQRIIYTDIERVDKMIGVDYPKIRDIAKVTRVKLTVAGGVQSEEDIQQLIRLTRYHVDSVIVGKAIYALKFNILNHKEAIRSWKNKLD